MATAARRVIITAERVVHPDELRGQPELTTINDLNVAAVVEAPRGAWPGACWPAYDIDHEAVRAYVDAARTPEGVARMLAETEAADHAAGAGRGMREQVGA
jgi:glutaconate CoA-transferase subunit A